MKYTKVESKTVYELHDGLYSIELVVSNGSVYWTIYKGLKSLSTGHGNKSLSFHKKEAIDELKKWKESENEINKEFKKMKQFFMFAKNMNNKKENK